MPRWFPDVQSQPPEGRDHLPLPQSDSAKDHPAIGIRVGYACQPQSLYLLFHAAPPRHLHSAVVDQGGLWASSGVLLARTSRTRKRLAHLLMLEGEHLQSRRRTQERDSCKGRGESAGSRSRDSTLASPKGYFPEARSPR